jgi:hypothetical protein
MNASNARQMIDSRRNGSDSNHTKGHKMMASMARGQHRTSKKHQATIKIKAFTVPSGQRPY